MRNWITRHGPILMMLSVLAASCATNTDNSNTETTLPPEPSPSTSTLAATTPPEGDSTPSRSEIDGAMAVADDYLARMVAGDIDGMVAMLTNPDAYEEGEDPYYYETMSQAFGQVLNNLECVEPLVAPLTVQCNATVLNDIQLAKGLNSCTTQLFITVIDGAVSSYTANDNCDSFYNEQWMPLELWIKANYPDDHALMYDLDGVTSHSGLMTEESIPLWFSHIDEYVAELSADA